MKTFENIRKVEVKRLKILEKLGETFENIRKIWKKDAGNCEKL